MLAFDRFALQGWETWRLLTAALVHTNAMHLLLNVVGLALLWALHGDYYLPGRFLRVLLFCSVVTSSCLYFLSPQLIWYVGLSGALHGLFFWGACVDIRMGLLSGWGLVIGGAIKVGYEQLGGNTADIAQLINAEVAIDAHLYGAISGILLSFLMPVVKSKPSPRDGLPASD